MVPQGGKTTPSARAAAKRTSAEAAKDPATPVRRKPCAAPDLVMASSGDIPNAARIIKVHPLDEYAQEEPFPYEADTYLKNFMKQNVIARLRVTEKEALRLWLLRHANFQFGTICSGTDGPAFAFKAFAEAASEELGVNASMRHSFSCEVNPDKRQFIQDFCNGVEVIYDDVKFLAEDTKAFDYKSQKLVSVPVVGNVTFGFPCQDGSSQNPNRKQNKDVVATAGGRTGLVFHQCLQHLQRNQTEMFFGLAENVLGLTHKFGDSANSNHDHCIDKFNSMLDAFALTFHVDPTLNGVPMHRPRIYMPFFYRSVLRQFGCDDRRTEATLTELVQRFAGRSQIPLSRFLLPEDHPIIVKYYRPLIIKGLLQNGDAFAAACRDIESIAVCKIRGGVAKKAPRKKDKHDETFHQMGYKKEDVWRASEQDLEMWPGLRAVPDRGFDILHHFKVEFPEATLRAFDISQSLARLAGHAAAANGAANAANVIVDTMGANDADNLDKSGGEETTAVSTFHSHTATYLTNRCRLLHPVEQFRVLGMHFGSSDDKLMDTPTRLLQDLAGNAMELTSVGLVFAACVVFLAVAEHEHQQSECGNKRRRLRASASTASSTGCHDETLDSLWG